MNSLPNWGLGREAVAVVEGNPGRPAVNKRAAEAESSVAHPSWIAVPVAVYLTNLHMAAVST